MSGVVKQRRPELDGLRAGAIAAVVAYHSGLGIFRGGYVGVDLFFVLSGYLITGLIVREYELRHRVDLGRFYLRRLLRLFPALVLALVITAALLSLMASPHEYGAYAKAVPYAATYTANFAAVFHGPQYNIGVMWSLALEEQFYLIWPFLLLLLLRRRLSNVRIAIGLGALAALSVAFLVLQYKPTATHGVPATYFSPTGRCGALLLGCALFFMLAEGRLVLRRPGLVAALASLGLVIIVALAPQPYLQPWFLLATPVTWVLSAALLLATLQKPPRVLRWRPVAWVGEISYGIYLFHVPVYRAVSHQVNASTAANALVAAVLTVLLAALSFYTLERYFNRRKDRMGGGFSLWPRTSAAWKPYVARLPGLMPSAAPERPQG